MSASMRPIAILSTIACLSVGCHFERDRTDAPTTGSDAMANSMDSAQDFQTLEVSSPEVLALDSRSDAPL